MDRRAAAIKRLAAESPVTFMIFDLLWLDGHSLLDLPEVLEAIEEARAAVADLDPEPTAPA